MFDKFGEFNSAEELNKMAKELKEAGRPQEVIELALENGIDKAEPEKKEKPTQQEETQKPEQETIHSVEPSVPEPDPIPEEELESAPKENQPEEPEQQLPGQMEVVNTDVDVEEVTENKEPDYNKLFSKLQEDCIHKNCSNAFASITVDELVDLNNLLDRLIVFCENVDTDELEDCECGIEVMKLYRLADTLFTRDLNN